MRVAFISQPWNRADPPVESGSVAIWNYQVTRRLAQFCDVIVYGQKYKPHKDSEFSEGVRYRYMSTSLDRRLRRILILLSCLGHSKRPYFSSRLYYLAYIVRVALDLRKAGCDIVHVQNLSQFVPIIRAFNPLIKIVLHMHCEWLSQLDRRMIERRVNKTDLVLGCSEYVTDKIRRRFPCMAARCRTLYNGVDIRCSVPPNTKLVGTAKRILFVGRVSPEKGLHVLVDAFQRVAEVYPNVQLDIVGPRARCPVDYVCKLSDDPKVSDLIAFDRTDYIRYLKERLSPSLMGSASFPGTVPHSALGQCYAAADLYVQPSFTETFGVPIAEAMAAGVPVVGTRVGGISEVIEDGKTGVLVEAGNTKMLADAILAFLHDEDLRERMGKAAHERAAKLFSWDQITKTLLGLYDYITRGYEEDVPKDPGTSILPERAQSHCRQVQ